MRTERRFINSPFMAEKKRAGRTRLTHLALAEEVLLSEGEEDDVPEVSRMLQADVLSSVLQHSTCFVDDPVWAEQGQGHAARCPHDVDTDVHRQAAVPVTHQANAEKFCQLLLDPNVTVPVATLILDQHHRHDFAAEACVQKVGCASFWKIIRVCGALGGKTTHSRVRSDPCTDTLHSLH